MIKKSLSSVICLTVICLVITGLLAVTNAFTAPVIEKADKQAANAAKLIVYSSAKSFEDVCLTAELTALGVSSASKADDGGFVIEVTTSGFNPGLKLMFGVDNSFKVVGATCLISSETNKAEVTYGEKLIGATLDSVDSIDTVAGSTKTSTAYRNAAKTAIQASVLLSGGTVDTRTPEQILNDSLNEAMGTTGISFEPWFATADLGAITNAYIADCGIAFKADETFAAVNSDGTLKSNATSLSDDEIINAYNIIKNDTLTDVDITGVSVSNKVVSVQKSAAGNYVFTVNGSGFGKNGPSEYGISGQFIVIKVCVSKDGTILNCVTVSQAETDGIGSVCADASYYSQYVGKNYNTIDSVDAIAGATFTSKGYKTAVTAAIESAKALKEAGR